MVYGACGSTRLARHSLSYMPLHGFDHGIEVTRYPCSFSIQKNGALYVHELARKSKSNSSVPCLARACPIQLFDYLQCHLQLIKLFLLNTMKVLLS